MRSFARSSWLLLGGTLWFVACGSGGSGDDDDDDDGGSSSMDCTAGADSCVTGKGGSSARGGSGSGGSSSLRGEGSGGSSAGGTGGGTSGNAGEPPVIEEPHALGTVLVAETHLADTDDSTGSVSAFFLPDVSGKPVDCSRAIGACRVASVPDCGDCGSGRYCTFDDSCQPTCKDACNLDCASDEICLFDAGGAAVCGPKEVFDAGDLTLTGGSETISMPAPPPYSGSASGTEPLFSSEAALSIHATGSQSAGFRAFEQGFTATTLMKSTLADLSREAVFGDDTLTITWAPANDEVMVTLSISDHDGGSATLNCKANDALGSLSIPRQTLLEVLGGKPMYAAVAAVTRSRKEVHEGFETTGSLPRSTVRSNGVLELSTQSMETKTFLGCQKGYAMCGENCVNVNSSLNNCGSCGNVCPEEAVECRSGVCELCDSSDTYCDGDCTDTDTDEDNCGECGKACAANAYCYAGKCETCPDGELACPSAEFDCTDVSEDYDNCGECGNVCDYDCVDGKCVEEPVECDDSEDECGGKCVDLNTDPKNCGKCGNDCGGAACEYGECDEPTWDCDASYLDDGSCDCGCGAQDTDCSGLSASLCDYCWCSNDEEDCSTVQSSNNTQCK